jgi:hypothetical protein
MRQNVELKVMEMLLSWEASNCDDKSQLPLVQKAWHK